MPNFNYITGVPDTPNDPSNDQPNMKINNDNNELIWNQDHIGFKQNNGGLHKQVQVKEGTLPAGLQNGFETLYAKLVAGSGEFFISRGNTGIEIQLTGPGNPVASSVDGQTFLPGGFVAKWGGIGGTGSSTHNFSPPFLNACFFVLTTPYFAGVDPNGVASVSIKNTVGDLDKNHFTYVFNTSSAAYAGFFWLAIGN